MKIEKSVQITLIIAGVILIVALLLFSLMGRVIPNLNNVVTVQGDSEIQVAPDLVSIYLTIDETGDNSTSAKDAADGVYARLLQALRYNGVSEDEVKTQNYNIYEDYTWTNGNRRLNGYRATHSLKIEISADESDLVSEILDAGIEAGASLSHINFELSSELENTYKAQALLYATQDARAKAEAIAEGLDENLGRLVSVSTDHFYYEPWKAYDYVLGGVMETVRVEESVNQIIPSERTVSAMVTVTYKL